MNIFNPFKKTRKKKDIYEEIKENPTDINLEQRLKSEGRLRLAALIAYNRNDLPAMRSYEDILAKEGKIVEAGVTAADRGDLNAVLTYREQLSDPMDCLIITLAGFATAIAKESYQMQSLFIDAEAYKIVVGIQKKLPEFTHESALLQTFVSSDKIVDRCFGHEIIHFNELREKLGSNYAYVMTRDPKLLFIYNDQVKQEIVNRVKAIMNR